MRPRLTAALGLLLLSGVSCWATDETDETDELTLAAQAGPAGAAETFGTVVPGEHAPVPAERQPGDVTGDWQDILSSDVADINWDDVWPNELVDVPGIVPGIEYPSALEVEPTVVTDLRRLQDPRMKGFIKPGTRVRIEGPLVTAGRHRAPYFFVQNARPLTAPYSGILVIPSSGLQQPVEGNRVVRLDATVSEETLGCGHGAPCRTQTVLSDVTAMTYGHTSRLPIPLEVKSQALLEDPEPYEGTLVALTDLSVVGVGSLDGRLVIRVGGPLSIYCLWATPEETPARGWQVERVSGPVAFHGRDVFIYPRFESDLILTPAE